MKHLSSERLSPDTQPFTLNHIQQLCLTQHKIKKKLSPDSVSPALKSISSYHVLYSLITLFFWAVPGLTQKCCPQKATSESLMPTANFCAYVGAAKSEEQRTIWVHVHSENWLLNMEIGTYKPKMLCASLTKVLPFEGMRKWWWEKPTI